MLCPTVGATIHPPPIRPRLLLPTTTCLHRKSIVLGSEYQGPTKTITHPPHPKEGGSSRRQPVPKTARFPRLPRPTTMVRPILARLRKVWTVRAAKEEEEVTMTRTRMKILLPWICDCAVIPSFCCCCCRTKHRVHSWPGDQQRLNYLFNYKPKENIFRKTIDKVCCVHRSDLLF